MSIVKELVTGKVRIYACGGCGTNISKQFYELPVTAGVSNIDVCFLDTSRSNFDSTIKEKDTFIIDGIDGSGKIRSENYEAINNVIKQIPSQFAPGDLNLVVFSGSGGSGNVFAALLLVELLNKGHAAIAMMVGSYESIIAGKNTLNTIKTLDTMARKNKKPIVVSFANNADNTKRKEADVFVANTIKQLSILASRHHREMDSQDLFNWLRFDRHTGVEPQLSLLTVSTKVEEIKDQVSDPISIASLVIEGGDTSVGNLRADYQVTGYMDATCPLADAKEIHFVVNIADTPDLVAVYEKEVQTMTDKSNARAKISSYVDKETDRADDNGMVL
jgi:hypothetical protein